MNRYVSLLLFLLLVVGGGSVIGTMNIPGPWYEGLDKPFFNPPNWLFGPVWTLLYIMIAIAGWRTFEHRRSGTAMNVWWLQLVLNFAWSPTFFTLQSLAGALVVALAMFASIAAFIALSWREDRVSALLFVPYLAWVGFASLLNASLLWLN